MCFVVSEGIWGNNEEVRNDLKWFVFTVNLTWSGITWEEGPMKDYLGYVAVTLPSEVLCAALRVVLSSEQEILDGIRVRVVVRLLKVQLFKSGFFFFHLTSCKYSKLF